MSQEKHVSIDLRQYECPKRFIYHAALVAQSEIEHQAYLMYLTLEEDSELTVYHLADDQVVLRIFLQENIALVMEKGSIYAGIFNAFDNDTRDLIRDIMKKAHEKMQRTEKMESLAEQAKAINKPLVEAALSSALVP